MSRFFIDRPIFAWVIAILIMVAGAVSIARLPIAQYPTVAPTTITVTATYPGASAETLEDSVLAIIEREMFSAKSLAYMETIAQSNGTGTITLSFDPGVDPDLAQVDVQNLLTRATPRLPDVVTKQGVRVQQTRSNFLMFVMLTSKNPAVSVDALDDYAARNIVPELQRLPGIGQVRQFGAERAMRVWVDPAKLKGYGLTMADVSAAIAAQNVQVSAGSLGSLPAVAGQQINATIVVKGQLPDAEQFRNILLRANTDGSTVRLRDVASVALGQESYNFVGRFNGERAVGIGIQPSPSGNALATVKLVRAKLQQLQAFFPDGVSYSVPYDSSTFVSLSIEKVVHTLFEAIVLVFLVMFLFLQNVRYTIIPTIVVPVALLGTFSVLLALGFSINVLTMFGLVLVIGIVVDDAIVVVENVERIMSTEGLPPVEATRKAMGQISGAIVGITVVLVSVFVPLAFFSGSIGNIYKQFAATMASSIAFSAFLALSLTPALCATLLKPVEAGHHLAKGGFFGGFNRGFNSTAKSYERGMAWVLRHAGRLMIVYVVIAAVVVFVYTRLPTSFLPNEDQGVVMANVQLPPGATQSRADAVLARIADYMKRQPEAASVFTVAGFSFSGQGQNAAFAVMPLKDWSQRKGEEHSAQAVAARANRALAPIRDAFIFTLSPPPIPELGRATGFTFRLEDRGSKGHAALLAARNQLLGMAAQSKVLAGVRPDNLEDAPQVELVIDRDKAAALGVSYAAIDSALSTALGSSYINDFPNQNREQRVVVQAQPDSRMQPAEVLDLPVANSRGQVLPLSAFASIKWFTGPVQTVRYNGYPAMSIAGDAAPGYSTGEAMNEMERLAARLPEGFGYEWTGQSREERLAGSQGLVLYSFSVLIVFLCLAALYESWSIPLSVILVVPLGVLGVVLATLLRGYANDVYFQIGLVTIIGLSAKNAILIIEFAKDLQAQGRSVLDAALQAAHLRFRPILMTSLAFMLGVLPLFFASGASSASQHAIGTGVFGGMITGTVLAVVFVPAFFVVVRRIFKSGGRNAPPRTEPAAEGGARHE